MVESIGSVIGPVVPENGLNATTELVADFSGCRCCFPSSRRVDVADNFWLPPGCRCTYWGRVENNESRRSEPAVD